MYPWFYNLTRTRPAAAFPLLAAAAALLGGCGRENIEVYEVPRESAAAAAPAHSAGDGHNHGAMPQETLQWKLPEGWEPLDASGVRAAAFNIPGQEGQTAEVAVMPFNRMGGSDLQFVNLWRQTLGLQPVDEAGLQKLVQPITIGQDEGKFYDVMDQADAAGQPITNRIVVAMIVRGETSWFFKLAGTTALVDAQMEHFKGFLKSVTFQEPPEAPAAPAMAAPAAPAQPAAGTPAKPEWTVPARWKEVAPTSMLLAKFEVQNDAGASAEITVSVFPGDVGGLLANVNRWRAQVGLAPVGDAELGTLLSPLQVGGLPATLVDLSGPSPESGQKASLLGVVLPRAGHTWFFKFLGDAQVAAQERDSFLQFVQSTRYPND